MSGPQVRQLDGDAIERVANSFGERLDMRRICHSEISDRPQSKSMTNLASIRSAASILEINIVAVFNYISLYALNEISAKTEFIRTPVYGLKISKC